MEMTTVLRTIRTRTSSWSRTTDGGRRRRRRRRSNNIRFSWTMTRPMLMSLISFI